MTLQYEIPDFPQCYDTVLANPWELKATLEKNKANNKCGWGSP